MGESAKGGRLEQIPAMARNILRNRNVVPAHAMGLDPYYMSAARKMCIPDARWRIGCNWGPGTNEHPGPSGRPHGAMDRLSERREFTSGLTRICCGSRPRSTVTSVLDFLPAGDDMQVGGQAHGLSLRLETGAAIRGLPLKSPPSLCRINLSAGGFGKQGA